MFWVGMFMAVLALLAGSKLIEVILINKEASFNEQKAKSRGSPAQSASETRFTLPMCFHGRSYPPAFTISISSGSRALRLKVDWK